MADLEIDLENAVVAQALSHYGVPSIKLNIMGNTGYPDRLFFVDGGKPLLIEFKRPGEAPKPKQAYIHKALRERGYNVAVSDNEKEAIEAIEAAVGASRLHEKGDEISARTGERSAVSRPRTTKN